MPSPKVSPRSGQKKRDLGGEELGLPVEFCAMAESVHQINLPWVSARAVERLAGRAAWNSVVDRDVLPAAVLEEADSVNSLASKPGKSKARAVVR